MPAAADRPRRRDGVDLADTIGAGMSEEGRTVPMAPEPAHGERSTGGRWRKRVLQALWLVTVALLLEGTVRVFFRLRGEDVEVWRQFTTTRSAQLSITDETLGSRLLPSAARNVLTSEFRIIYRTNSLGLREREIAPTTAFKVIFLGDSQTFGEGVEVAGDSTTWRRRATCMPSSARGRRSRC